MRSLGITRVVLAALVYVSVVFAAGFLLGVLRTILLAPRVGATTAVLIEVPLMLAVCWSTCARTTRAFLVATTGGSRILMGAIAFTLLLLAELIVSRFALGRSLREHFAGYVTTPGLIGLAAQLVFALVPILQLKFPKAGVNG